jgi:hypothetical protein
LNFFRGFCARDWNGYQPQIDGWKYCLTLNNESGESHAKATFGVVGMESPVPLNDSSIIAWLLWFISLLIEIETTACAQMIHSMFNTIEWILMNSFLIAL